MYGKHSGRLRRLITPRLNLTGGAHCGGNRRVFTVSARGGFRLAVLASRVNYHEGDIERVKKLEFQDGLEMAVLPKARIKLS